ncbi:MAG: OmpH family outer membrane protein [Taibaiella sp.]|nr:OmpH family outer membrane protein [Taibaiella sp.]
MKNFSLASGCLLVLSAGILLGSCGSNTGSKTPEGSQPVAAGGGAKIAYVNIDSLENHYELLKSRREDFKKRQEQMEGELQQSFQQMQRKGEALQKRVQDRSISENEYKTTEKELIMMQQSLEGRKQNLTEQLVKEQEEFNKDLKKRLDAYLETYNKDKHYDFILTYSAGGGSPIMYANKQLDITKDVIDGMNANSKNETGGKNK